MVRPNYAQCEICKRQVIPMTSHDLPPTFTVVEVENPVPENGKTPESFYSSLSRLTTKPPSADT